MEECDKETIISFGEDLVYEDMLENDTRSSTSSSAGFTQSSTSSMSPESSSRKRKRSRHKRSHSRLRGPAKKSFRNKRSVSSEKQRSESKVKSKRKSYDYKTKLNYLFRGTRFFIMKSDNAENVALSKAEGVWSTLPRDEIKLNQAYRETRNVLLIFSVNESRRFAGFARLDGESRRDVAPVPWVLPPGVSAKALGGVFKVDWICRKGLTFSYTKHLYNPWNHGKPVKIARNGQEIEPKVAEQLCHLFPVDEGIEMTPILRKSKAAAKQPHSTRYRYNSHQSHYSWHEHGNSYARSRKQS